MTSKKSLATIIILGITEILWSQQIPDQLTAGDAIVLKLPQVSLIDTDHAQIEMELTANTAGESIETIATNSDMWIKVTSVVPGGTHRDIKAKITGTIPSGTILKLQAAPATPSHSAGVLGSPNASPLTLSAVDQYLIYNIGSCYTGTGPTDGYNLTYTWSIVNPTVNFGNLEATPSTTITIYFTLTESNNSTN